MIDDVISDPKESVVSFRIDTPKAAAELLKRTLGGGLVFKGKRTGGLQVAWLPGNFANVFDADEEVGSALSHVIAGRVIRIELWCGSFAGHVSVYEGGRLVRRVVDRACTDEVRAVGKPFAFESDTFEFDDEDANGRGIRLTESNVIDFVKKLGLDFEINCPIKFTVLRRDPKGS